MSITIDWWGLFLWAGLWIFMFGNEFVDMLLAWRFPELRRQR